MKTIFVHMKFMRFLFLALCCMLLWGGCRKEVEVPENSLEKLFGSWNLFYVTGGGWGKGYEPASQGYSQTIEFNKDGTYRLLRTDKRDEKGHYSFEPYSGSSSYVIKYRNKPFREDAKNQFPYFTSDDTLILAPTCSDCRSEMYVRRK